MAELEFKAKPGLHSSSNFEINLKRSKKKCLAVSIAKHLYDDINKKTRLAVQLGAGASRAKQEHKGPL